MEVDEDKTEPIPEDAQEAHVGAHAGSKVPKGVELQLLHGVIAGEEESLFGNVGVAMRYWFKRGSWSPTLEVSSGISFWLRGTRGEFGGGPQRSPLGLTGDVGVGVGGWGALIVGGQINTALSRSELPDEIRISTSGSFFVGFRGNIAWGLPAAASVATHGLTQRYGQSP